MTSSSQIMKYVSLVIDTDKGEIKRPKYPVSIGDFIIVNLTFSLNFSGCFHFFIISLISVWLEFR